MAQLVARAKKRGVRPADYARELVEDGLALRREAESMTIGQIMKPVRKAAGAIDEAELVGIVEQARSDHHRSASRGKRR